MSLDNQITLRGFVTAEPKFRQTVQTATPFAEIRVGSTPRRLNRETGEWQDAPTSYYTVKCWRRLAVNAVASLKKGDMVVIRGRFYMRSWLDGQQRPRSVLEIEADSLGHDLAYGWSHFLRGMRPQSGRAEGLNEGEQARQDTGAPGPDDGDDEYLGESPEERPGPGDQADPAQPGFTDDLASDDPASAGPFTLAGPADEDEEFGDFDPAAALPAPRAVDDVSLPEPEPAF
jgi:single-strand DNA-binding protein